jgi:hypothetical protein
MRGKKDPLPLYHDPQQPMSLGCTNCRERDICGGLHAPHLFSCLDFCECNESSKCGYMCRNNIKLYIEMFREICGFDFKDIPRTSPLNYPSLPQVVPLFYHSSRREELFAADTVAVPLSHLFNYRTGKARFSTRQDLAHAYGFNVDARLVITGVDKDPPIERFWEASPTGFAECLAALQPSLVTVPNYSVCLNVPRWENLYSMKRIAICWSELVSAGVPTSLHPNARTDRDWERWTDFVAEREEVQSLTYEFATGAAKDERGRWHVEKLMQLGATVRRPLQIVIRGGYKYLNMLHKAFNEVVFVDTSSFMKTVNRQRFEWYPGRIGKWQSRFTLIGQPIDDLLQHNVSTFAKMIVHKVENGEVVKIRN